VPVPRFWPRFAVSYNSVPNKRGACQEANSEDGERMGAVASYRRIPQREPARGTFFPPSVHRWSNLRTCGALAGLFVAVVAFATLHKRASRSSAKLTLASQLARVPCAKKLGENPKVVDARHLSELEFLAVGDWGLDTSSSNDDGPRDDWGVKEMQELAREMKNRIDGPESNVLFVLNVGDSFYQYGINSVDDVRWRTTFEDVFGSERPIPWYSALGNHDYKGNLKDRNLEPDAGTRAQIMRTFHPKNKQWCMPDHNFVIQIKMKMFDLVVVVFDSQTLVRLDPDVGTGAYQGESIPDPKAELKWLKDTLCTYGIRTKKKLKSGRGRPVVLMSASHHFLTTVGTYFNVAHAQEKIMRDKVYPILRKCGVRVHFHGHDHVTEVLEVHNSLLQVGVGSAGKLNGFIQGSQKELDQFYGDGEFTIELADRIAAFAKVRVDEDTVAVEVINHKGELMKSFPIRT